MIRAGSIAQAVLGGEECSHEVVAAEAWIEDGIPGRPAFFGKTQSAPWRGRAVVREGLVLAGTNPTDGRSYVDLLPPFDPMAEEPLVRVKSCNSTLRSRAVLQCLFARPDPGRLLTLDWLCVWS